VGSGAAAVPLELGGLLKDWIEAPDLEEFRHADPRQLIATALAGIERYVLPDIVDGGHFTWEGAGAEYAALVTSWWAGAHEATPRTPASH